MSTKSLLKHYNQTIVVDQGPLESYRNANHQNRGVIVINLKPIIVVCMNGHILQMNNLKRKFTTDIVS